VERFCRGKASDSNTSATRDCDERLGHLVSTSHGEPVSGLAFEPGFVATSHPTGNCAPTESSFSPVDAKQFAQLRGTTADPPLYGAQDLTRAGVFNDAVTYPGLRLVEHRGVVNRSKRRAGRTRIEGRRGN
jgi:hypothetical protein